jgi:hypothetical protein
MQASDDFLGVNDLKLSEFTKVLPVAVFFIRYYEGSAGVLFHFLIVGK